MSAMDVIRAVDLTDDQYGRRVEFPDGNETARGVLTKVGGSFHAGRCALVLNRTSTRHVPFDTEVTVGPVAAK